MSHWVTQFADDISPKLLTALSSPETLIEQGTVIKDDKSTTVVKYVLEDQQYIIKRFNARNKRHAVKRALRKTRARNCWDMSNILLKCGVEVATPIAFLEARYGIIKTDSYFVSSYLEGFELLHWLPKQNVSLQLEVTKQVKKVFKVFAEQKLSHGDMKATNLLWSEIYQRLVLIDLDAAKQHSNELLFARAHARDKRRFIRNGELFKQMLV